MFPSEQYVLSDGRWHLKVITSSTTKPLDPVRPLDSGSQTFLDTVTSCDWTRRSWQGWLYLFPLGFPRVGLLLKIPTSTLSPLQRCLTVCVGTTELELRSIPECSSYFRLVGVLRRDLKSLYRWTMFYGLTIRIPLSVSVYFYSDEEKGINFHQPFKNFYWDDKTTENTTSLGPLLKSDCILSY